MVLRAHRWSRLETAQERDLTHLAVAILDLSGYVVVPSQYADAVQIGSSARKHGVSDEDIRHALRFPQLTTDEPASARRLVLGPDHAGNILELVVLDPDTDPVVIHAMPARPRFLRLLNRRR